MKIFREDSGHIEYVENLIVNPGIKNIGPIDQSQHLEKLKKYESEMRQLPGLNPEDLEYRIIKLLKEQPRDFNTICDHFIFETDRSEIRSVLAFLKGIDRIKCDDRIWKIKV